MILETTCGIYKTIYELTCHKDSSVTLKSPYIKWENNSGTLKFKKKIFFGELALKIKKAFKNGTICLEGYNCATLDDARDGQLGDGK